MEDLDTQAGNIEMEDPLPHSTIVDFRDTEIAFANKSDRELKKTRLVFQLMNNPTLVKIGSFVAYWLVKIRFPFIDFVVKNTIYDQFCGGLNLLDCQKAIDKLYKHDALTILDYGAEGKSNERDLNKVRDENIKAIEMAASNNSVPGIGVKLTGLVQNEVLEALHAGKTLNQGQKVKYEKLLERVHQICEKAHEHGVGVFIDAEESWIQDPIDRLTLELMELYNKERVIVYNTYQLYRHDKLAQLKTDHERMKSKGCFFGAKLVRGAYMEKENTRAEEMGYPTPIQPDKDATDRDFDKALDYCLDHYQSISFVCASHNLKSNLHLANRVEELGLDKDHLHINFCQLYGMSDYITFNLAAAGYNVAKYVPYGPVVEVIPYLIRRAQENTSVTGEMGRELSLVHKEAVRRGL